MVSIDENPALGQIIGAIVSNGTGTLNYSLMNQTPNGALSIDSNSGELTVADETLFDFEVNPVITASVSDGEAPNAATVTINLSNINEVTIEGFDESIDENPSNGDVIGTVLSDAIGNPNFSIVSQTPAGAINIDSNTGEVTVADATLFDYESHQFVDAVIAADDAMNSSDFVLEIDNVNEIGDFNFGGVIFWVNATGDEGLVCAVTDQGVNVAWGCQGTFISGTSTSIGTGAANTSIILAGCSTSGIAADIAANTNIGSYSDWFLPSKDELNQMYIHKDVIDATAITNGGTAFTSDTTTRYWSSSESNNNTSWCKIFGTGIDAGLNKDAAAFFRVRVVRSWTDF